jgi:proline iminopeptidase
MPRVRHPALLAAGALVVLAATRPRLRNWGSTVDDRSRVLPGDWLIPDERGLSTMAITVDAPCVAVWPWLAQMGTDRAGWYSFDHLDRGGRPSARELDPRWTHVAEGDRMVTVPGRSWFDVAHVEVNRSLVLRATLDLRGLPYDPNAGRPWGFVDARWEFFLDPLVDGSTRLIVRSGSASGSRPWTDIMDLAFWHPAHVIMQMRQLRQLKLRAEQHAQAVAVAGAAASRRAPSSATSRRAIRDGEGSSPAWARKPTRTVPR